MSVQVKERVEGERERVDSVPGHKAEMMRMRMRMRMRRKGRK